MKTHYTVVLAMLSGIGLAHASTRHSAKPQAGSYGDGGSE